MNKTLLSVGSLGLMLLAPSCARLGLESSPTFSDDKLAAEGKEILKEEAARMYSLSALAPAAAGGPHALQSTASRTLEYDRNGNLVRDSSSSSVTTYAYDTTLHLKTQSVTIAGNTMTATYDRDADGNAVSTTMADGAVLTYLSGMVRTVSRSGAAPVALVSYAAGETDEQGVMKYFVKDHLGSVVAVASASGMEEVRDTLPYGNEWYSERVTPRAEDRGFNGKIKEGIAEAGKPLWNFEARHYDGSGAFFQADTIVPDPDSVRSYNRYAFVRNNPANRVDPTGHAEDIWQGWDKRMAASSSWEARYNDEGLSGKLGMLRDARTNSRVASAYAVANALEAPAKIGMEWVVGEVTGGLDGVAMAISGNDMWGEPLNGTQKILALASVLPAVPSLSRLGRNAGPFIPGETRFWNQEGALDRSTQNWQRRTFNIGYGYRTVPFTPSELASAENLFQDGNDVLNFVVNDRGLLVGPQSAGSMVRHYHSQLGGQSVFAAGEIRLLENGNVAIMFNNSGHFKPGQGFSFEDMNNYINYVSPQLVEHMPWLRSKAERFFWQQGDKAGDAVLMEITMRR